MGGGKIITFYVFINSCYKIITNYVLMLLTVGLAGVQAQLPSDSVVPGDLNGQETDVVFIYSLPCNAVKNSAQ